ncbi:MAG: histidine kinase [Dermatophilaceae bacterium]
MRWSGLPRAARSGWERVREDLDAGPKSPPLNPWQTTWRLILVALVGYGSWAATGLQDAATHSTGRWVLLAVDAFVGLVAIAIVQRRRAHPVSVAVVLALLGGVFLSVTGATLLALASLAARRNLRGLALVIPLMVAMTLVSELVWPPEDPLRAWQTTAGNALVTVAFAAVAYAIGANRALVESLRERATAAEREQAAREAEGRAAERNRIAREMHDVLAHRISLVAMHAGALTYREDLSREDQRTAAATIERNARQALTELREILGVLRNTDEEASGPAPEAPQPTLRDIPALVADARSLGADVTVTDDSGEVPAGVARTAYRIIQEGLTNARKHAPGLPVSVRLAGGDDAPLTITVAQPAGPGAARTQGAQRMRPRGVGPTPGAGLGLLGLHERVALHGGTLESGPDPEGRWVLRARIPLHS